MIRNLATVYVWARAATHMATFAGTARMQTWSAEPQGESITFSADGWSWISMTERARTIYQASCP
jgi:hypothetical protein